MSKKISGVVVLAGMCALSLFLLSCGSSSSRPTGLLYVLTQGSNVGNNVSSFAIDLGNGNLSLINSNASTCKDGTCGLPIDILLDPTGGAAFVLGQAAITSYTVNSDGSFGAPSAPLVLASTAIAMKRDAAGQFLYVLESGTNPMGNCPLVGSNNPMYSNCPSVEIFAMQPGSTTLTPAAGSPFYIGKTPSALSVLTFPAATGDTTPPCGFTTSEAFLFITSTHDLSNQHNDNALSVYCADSSGNLTDKTPDPPYMPEVDPLSVLAVNTFPTGQTTGGIFVYVGSQPSASGALTIFQLCTTIENPNCSQQNVDNALLLPVTTPAPPSIGQNPVAMLVDPTNSFLYVLCYLSSQVYGYHINTTAGTLTALNPANLPTGSLPVAMAMHPSTNNSAQFLYTSNSNSSNISGFSLGTTSGSMSSLPPTIAPGAPNGMAAR